MNHTLLALKPALVLVASVAWWLQRHRFAQGTWLVGAQLLIAFFVEAYALFLAYSHQLNLWWYDLYVPIELTLLLAYARGHLAHRWQRRAVIPAWALLLAAYAADLRMNYPEAFVSAAYICGSVVLVVAYLALLYDLALRVDVALQRQPLFWVHVGIALFFAGMVPLLGLWNRLTAEDGELAANLFIANHVLFTIRYGTIVIACAIPGIPHRPGPP